MMMILGNIFDAAKRGTGKVAWAHSAQDAAALVRDMTKWDDAPHSLSHYAESMVRAYKIAMTPPMMPVALVLDVDLQEEEIPQGTEPRIPKLGTLVPPAADSAAIAEESAAGGTSVPSFGMRGSVPCGISSSCKSTSSTSATGIIGGVIAILYARTIDSA